MSGKWKPGDVAMVTWTRRSDPLELVGIMADDGDWVTIVGRIDGDAEARPLVVIDPEDRFHLERLARTQHIALTGNVPAWSTLSGKSRASRMDALAIALDAEIASPKPEEPTGLGAVVEDDGREWIHFGNGCWIKSVPNANLETRSWWEFSDAVREVTP